MAKEKLNTKTSDFSSLVQDKKVLEEINRLQEQRIEIAQRYNNLSDTSVKTAAKLKKEFEDVNKKIGGLIRSTKDLERIGKSINDDTEKQVDSWTSLSNIYKQSKKQLLDISLRTKELRSVGSSIAASSKLDDKQKESALKKVESISDSLSSISEKSKELADLSLDDADKRMLVKERIEDEIASLADKVDMLKKNNALSASEKAFLDSLIQGKKDELDIANQISSQSKLQKEIQEELHEELHGIQKTIHKIKDGVKMLFSGWQGGLALATFGASILVEKMGETNKELGVGVGQMFALSTEATVLGMILGDEARTAVIDLAKDLGNAHHVTTAMAVDAALLANNYGLSGQQVGFLSTAFGELQGLSYEAGKNTFAYVKQLSIANDVAPAQVMKDIAENTEFFATYSRDGGKNIGDAAVAAARLGTSLSTVSKVADHLLDYQTSVSDEMEATVLLGRDINLSKARELIYNGQIEDGMKAALEAAGGIAEFNKMDPYQRMATAKALGVSVGELQQMVAHEENLNGMNGIGNQLYSQTEEILQSIGNSLGGKILGGLGAVIMGIGQWNMAMQGTNFQAGALIKKFFTLIGLSGSFVSNLFKSKGAKAIDAALGKGLSEKQIASGLGGKEARDAMQKKMAKGYVPKSKAELLEATKTKTKDLGSPVQGADTAKGKTDSLGKINYTNLLKAAAAILIMAGALFVLGKALQEFNTVEPTALLKMAGALVIVGLAMWGLSSIFSNPIMMTGLAAATLGFLGFGAAIFLVGNGIKAFSEGLSIISNVLPSLYANFLPLVGLIMPIFGLAAAITALSLSLAALSITGVGALPALAVLGFAGAAATGLFGGEEKAEEDKLLTEIRGLREDLVSGRVAVYLDGKKVNTGLALNQKLNKMGT